MTFRSKNLECFLQLALLLNKVVRNICYAMIEKFKNSSQRAGAPESYCKWMSKG